MIQRRNIQFLVLILGFIATQVKSLRFDLQSGLTKCIAEDIKNHAMTVGKYHIVNPNEGYPLPDTHKVTVRVIFFSLLFLLILVFKLMGFLYLICLCESLNFFGGSMVNQEWVCGCWMFWFEM